MCLILQMTKPIHNSGQLVTMDGGFCVMEGISELDRGGVFGQEFGRYLAKGVLGDQINTHFVNKPVGHSETLKQTIDGK